MVKARNAKHHVHDGVYLWHNYHTSRLLLTELDGVSNLNAANITHLKRSVEPSYFFFYKKKHVHNFSDQLSEKWGGPLEESVLPFLLGVKFNPFEHSKAMKKTWSQSQFSRIDGVW